jgi:hypothetical protein
VKTRAGSMNWKRKLGGSALGLIGFLLSPLSWWNDLFINVPLAVGFAWLISLAYPPAFAPAAVLGYWLTNVLGFILMHKGAQQLLAQADRKPYGRRALICDLSISLLYTFVIVLLVKLKVLQPITNYFHQK